MYPVMGDNFPNLLIQATHWSILAGEYGNPPQKTMAFTSRNKVYLNTSSQYVQKYNRIIGTQELGFVFLTFKDP